MSLPAEQFFKLLKQRCNVEKKNLLQLLLSILRIFIEVVCVYFHPLYIFTQRCLATEEFDNVLFLIAVANLKNMNTISTANMLNR